MSLQLGPSDTAGEPPAGYAWRSPLPLFVVLCFVFSVLVHAEPLAAAAAAADMHLQPGVVAGVCLSVAALFNLVILKLNFLLARRPAAAGPTTPPAHIASASRSPVALFMVLCLLMGAALHAEQLAAAAKEYQIDPAVVVSFVLAASALFHLLILSIHKSLARHQQVQDEQKQLRRHRGRVPLLPFIVLALVIPTAASAEKVLAADVADLPQEASVWALLALAVSFNIAIGSLYCFIIIAGPPPPAPTGAEPLSWSKASGAIISFIAAAAVLVLYMLLASGGASGAIAARS